MPRGLLVFQTFQSVDFVKKEIQAMSNSKATGLDDISVKLLQLSLDVIAEIYTFLLKSVRLRLNGKRQELPLFLNQVKI